MGIKFSSSVLVVKDISISRKFYEEILEQKVEIDYGANVAFSGGFAIWQVESAYKNMFRNSLNYEALPDKCHQLELYFETDDIDGVYQKLVKCGARMLHDMLEQSWGQRGFRVYDPDNYIVEIGEHMDTVIRRFFKAGLTVEQVSKRTSTPLAIVENIMKSE
jgi:uncharacterized glyoxalase superfamily protein PhnB